jgi:lipopolysaccharide export system permease protein
MDSDGYPHVFCIAGIQEGKPEMKIIQRYYIREFLKILSIMALGMALIFSIIDLINAFDDFMPDRISFYQLFHYVALIFPKYLYYLLPMSLLICSLFIFSQASRHRELTIIKAAGGKLKRLLSPFVFIGIFFSLFGFVIGDVIIPDFSERILDFKKTSLKKSEKLQFKEGTLWLRGTDGAFVRIELYIPENKSARGMSIFITKDASLIRRIEAEEALWVNGKGLQGIWRLKKVDIYDIEKGEISHAAEMEFPELESPDLFSKGIKNPEEMGIGELYTYMTRLKHAGFKDTKLDVDLHSKVSYPLVNFVMILLGISLSAMNRIGGGLFAAGLGLFISFVYWLFYTFMLSLGYARIMPPFAAAWVVPILFGTAALYLFSKIQE